MSLPTNCVIAVKRIAISERRLLTLSNLILSSLSLLASAARLRGPYLRVSWMPRSFAVSFNDAVFSDDPGTIFKD